MNIIINLVKKLTTLKKEDPYEQKLIKVLSSINLMSDFFKSNIMWKQPLYIHECIKSSVS